jgi:general stress protein 26
MTTPAPRPVDPSAVPALARAVVRADRAPLLATVDGDQPRLRPVSPLRVDGFTVYVGSLRRYHKTVELERNPRVEMCFLDAHHNQVRLSGTAEVVTDRRELDAVWAASALLRQFLGTIDDPEFVLYRIVPSRIRYMQEWALEYFEVPVEAAPRPAPGAPLEPDASS